MTRMPEELTATGVREVPAGPPGPAAGKEPGHRAADRIDQWRAAIEAELLLAMATAEGMARRCGEVRRDLRAEGDPDLAGRALEALARLLARRTGPAAEALFDFVAAEVAELPGPAPVVGAMLGAA